MHVLIRRTALVDDWRLLARVDPELPNEFLAEPVSRGAARDVFLATCRALEQLAQRCFETPGQPAVASAV